MSDEAAGSKITWLVPDHYVYGKRVSTDDRSVSFEPSREATVHEVLEEAYDRVTSTLGDINASYIAPDGMHGWVPSRNEWLVSPLIVSAGENPTADMFFFMRFMGLDDEGLARAGPSDQLLWRDFCRALALRDPLVRTDLFVLAPLTQLGGGLSAPEIDALVKVLSPIVVSAVNALANRLPSAVDRAARAEMAPRELRQAAQELISRGLKCPADLAVFVEMRDRWDASQLGRMLGVTETEAQWLLTRLVYVKDGVGLWERSRSLEAQKLRARNIAGG